MIDLVTRANTPTPPPLQALPTMQRRIVEAIGDYERATGEPCPGRVLARRFNLHPKTMQAHLVRLHRKGWLRTPGAPALLARRDDRRR